MEVRPATEDEVRAAREAGKILPTVRLALSMTSAVTSGEMHKNFYATLERGFTPINEHLGAYSGACSVVGAGPSIHHTHKELVGDVLAINSAIGYLLDQGIVPKFAMLWDAWEVVETFARPHPEITYLVASRCHPKVFERLKDCKVIVWHAGGDHDILEVMLKPEVMEKLKIPQPLIAGGSAGVTRAVYVASCLGYNDIHIFGADSCYSVNGDTHIRGSVVPEKDMWVSLGNGDDSPALWFRTTPEWCAQVNEYRSIYALSVRGNFAALTNKEGIFLSINLEVHGEGLMKAMHDRLVAKRKAIGDAKFIEEIGLQADSQWQMDKAATEVIQEPDRPLEKETA